MTARVAVVGLGTVGTWLLDELDRGAAGDVEVVLRTSGRDGAEGALAELDYDVLAEAVNSPAGGEPGTSFIRDALAGGNSVVTSDKWPVALHGVELAQTAQERGVAFRAESTVMSGTPLLAPLTEALAGAEPVSLRGVLNATVNRILTEMAEGASYEDALARAQVDGLAEPDPSADVDGRDESAKAMVLAALLFGRQLEPSQVEVRGISGLAPGEAEAVTEQGGTLRSVTTLAFDDTGELRATVEPTALDAEDQLANVSGIENAAVLQADPIGELTIRGPGAGLEIAGLGILTDLKAVVDRRG